MKIYIHQSHGAVKLLGISKLPVPGKLNICGYMREYFRSRSLLGRIVYLPTRPSILMRNLLLQLAIYELLVTWFNLEEESTLINLIWFSGFFTGFQGSSPPVITKEPEILERKQTLLHNEQRQGLPPEDSVKQWVPRSPLFRGRSNNKSAHSLCKPSLIS